MDRYTVLIVGTKETRPAPAPPPPADLARVIPPIRRALLAASDIDADDDRPKLLDDAGLALPPGLVTVWCPVGDTAGIVLWVRGGATDAVSVLASGIDEREDARAIDLAEHATGLPRWSDAASVVVAPRPVLATSYSSGAGPGSEEMIGRWAAAWAAAFFGLLGVGSADEPRGSAA